MCAENGLHLIKGQHVEVIEWPSPLEVASASAAGSEQVCRVRVVRSTTVSSSSTPDIPSSISASASVIIKSNIGSSSCSEGLVPMSVLRQFMSLRLSKTRNSFSNDGSSRHHQAAGGGGSARSSAAALASGTDAGDAASDSSSLSAVPSTSGGSTQRKTSFK